MPNAEKEISNNDLWLPPQMRYYGRKVLRWAGLIIHGSRVPSVKPWLKKRRMKRARQRHNP
jgi:hypothetical protein